MTDLKQGIIPEEVAFVPRGQKEVTFEFKGYEVVCLLKVLTNKEADDFTNKFVSIEDDQPEIDNAGLSEERILIGLLDINSTFGGKKWPVLTYEEKKEAISKMHPKLRDRIGKEIFGQTYVSKEESNFLESPF
jgi:hypothetical protein